MKKELFKTGLFIIFLTISTIQVFAQNYQFAPNKVSGIKVIIEQERPKIKRLGKAKKKDEKYSNVVVDPKISNLRKVEMIQNQAISKQLQNDLKNQVAASGAYISPTKATKKASITNKTNNGSPSVTTSNSVYIQNTVFNSNDLFEFGFIQRTYNLPYFRNNLTEALKTAINNGIMKVINPKNEKDSYGIHHNTNLQLGNLQIESSYFAHSVNPSVTITFKIPRNRYFVQITTPTVLGSDADPNAWIFFDAIINATIKLPVNTSQVTYLPKLDDVNVLITNISKPESRNWISKLAIEFGTLLTGHDFISELRKDKHFVFPTSSYNQELDKIRKSFAGIPSMRIDNYQDGNMLVLIATTKPEETIYLH